MDTANFAIAMGTLQDFMADATPLAGMLFTLAIVWLVLHYRGKARHTSLLGAREEAALAQISQVALRLEQRMTAIEQAMETETDNAYRKVG